MQIRIRPLLLGALLLLTGPAIAQVPSTMAPNTVICRLGVSAGPPQACPFASVFAAFTTDNLQPKTPNLTALLAIGLTGFPTQTGVNTWAARSITGTANEISVANSAGIAGNPIISLPAAITLTGKTVTGGTFNGAAFNGTLGATTPATIVGTSVGVVNTNNGTTSVTVTNANAGASANATVVFNTDAGTTGFLTQSSSGNSSFGGANSLALVNVLNAPLAFFTNNNERMVITGAGDIGIGTTSPSTQFHTTGGVRFQGATGAGSAGCVKNDASGNLSLGNSCLSSTFFIAASKLATAAVLPNSPTYSNGASGVGATLTAGSNSTLTVDGVVAAANDIILVQNQASSFQNGQYYVSTAGSGGAAWVLTRCTAAACGVQFNNAATMLAGATTAITQGSTNSNKNYTMIATVTTVGTDPATFVLSSSYPWGTSGSAVYYTAGNVGIGTQSPAAQLHTTGSVRLAGFGTGTPRIDTSGNLSTTSPVVPTGLNSNGIADNAAAINAALATGLEVHLPAVADPTTQCYRVKSDLIMSTPGQILSGDGQFRSKICVFTADAGTFTHGVIAFSSGEEGPQIRDISVKFEQASGVNSCNLDGSPNYTNAVANRALLTTYVPAVYAHSTPRFRIERFEVAAATVGIDMRGNSGGAVMIDLSISAFVAGLMVDGALDTVRADDFHFWNFGMTTDQACIFQSPGVVALDIGRADGMTMDSFLNISYLGVSAHLGVAGTAVDTAKLFMTNFAFDSNNGIIQTAGQLHLTNGYLTLAPNENVAAIVLAGGYMQVSNFWVLNGPTSSSPILLENTISQLTLTTGRFTADVVVPQISGAASATGSHIMLSNLYFAVPPGLNLGATPAINVGTGVKLSAHNISFPDTAIVTNTMIKTASDEFDNVTGVTGPAWICSHPAKVNAIWANNTGATCN